jgi:predicted small secreted protein
MKKQIAFSTFPGVAYTLLSKLLHTHTIVAGASMWSFILLTSTLYRSSLTTPLLSIPSTPYNVPTAILPLILIVVVSVLDHSASLFGHLCAAAMGYAWGAGFLKFLIPPEKILRWVEETFQLRQRLPGSYVSVERMTYGRYGVLGSQQGNGGVVGMGSVSSAEEGRRA